MRHLDFNWVYLAAIIGAAITGSLGLYFEYRGKAEVQLTDRAKFELEVKKLEDLAAERLEKRPCTP